jgi:hypothetical protein
MFYFEWHILCPFAIKLPCFPVCFCIIIDILFNLSYYLLIPATNLVIILWIVCSLKIGNYLMNCFFYWSWIFCQFYMHVDFYYLFTPLKSVVKDPLVLFFRPCWYMPCHISASAQQHMPLGFPQTFVSYVELSYVILCLENTKYILEFFNKLCIFAKSSLLTCSSNGFHSFPVIDWFYLFI